MDDLITERSSDSQATWVIDVLRLFIRHVIHGCLDNQAPADVRSTGAGINCTVTMEYVFYGLLGFRCYCHLVEYPTTPLLLRVGGLQANVWVKLRYL